MKGQEEMESDAIRVAHHSEGMNNANENDDARVDESEAKAGGQPNASCGTGAGATEQETANLPSSMVSSGPNLHSSAQDQLRPTLVEFSDVFKISQLPAGADLDLTGLELDVDPIPERVPSLQQEEVRSKAVASQAQDPMMAVDATLEEVDDLTAPVDSILLPPPPQNEGDDDVNAGLTQDLTVPVDSIPDQSSPRPQEEGVAEHTAEPPLAEHVPSQHKEVSAVSAVSSLSSTCDSLRSQQQGVGLYSPGPSGVAAGGKSPQNLRQRLEDFSPPMIEPISFIGSSAATVSSPPRPVQQNVFKFEKSVVEVAMDNSGGVFMTKRSLADQMQPLVSRPPPNNKEGHQSRHQDQMHQEDLGVVTSGRSPMELKARSDRTDDGTTPIQYTTPEGAIEVMLSSSRAGSMIEHDVDDVARVGRLVKSITNLGTLIWLLLVFITLRYAPSSSFEIPVGMEKNAHLFSFVLILVTSVAKVFPQLLFRLDRVSDFFRNGVSTGSFLIQLVVLISHAIMFFGPHPVVVDPIAGVRVQLIQWCEWIPLSFVMAFLLDNIDLPIRPNSAGTAEGTTKPRWLLAVFIGLSTSAGIVFPFCTTLEAWWTTLFVSWILFMPLPWHTYRQSVHFFQVRSRRLRFLNEGQAHDNRRKKDGKADPIYSRESYELCKAAFMLSGVCCAAWSLLAVVITIGYAEPQFPSSKRPLTVDKDSLAIGMSCFEVISKIWYQRALLDAYDNVFDESTRVARRLEELRAFMATVWESSSDVIIFVSEQGGNIQARVSPAFVRFIGMAPPRSSSITPEQPPSRVVPKRRDVSLVLEVLPKTSVFTVFAIDLAAPITRHSTVHKEKRTISLDLADIKFCADKPLEALTDSSSTPTDINLKILAQLVLEASRFSPGTLGKNEKNILYSFVDCGKGGTRDDAKSNGDSILLQCEATIAQLDNGSRTIILRDISDRIRRFEAEKHVLQETTIRKKDAEANRFTRHEVKNGLLAAIGLVDHLREVYASVVHTRSGVDGSSSSDTPKGPIVTTESSVKKDKSRVALDEQSDTTSNDRVASDSSGLSRTSGLQDAGFDELDTVLRDTLDTILDEATAREIVYEEYTPRREKLNVPMLLASIRRRSSPRFPILVSPRHFPSLLLDRQLLRHIYRNAVSNACKYGKRDGQVTTTVIYDAKEKTFRIEVTNEPGIGHELLAQLDESTIQTVFNPGTQLSVTHVVNDQEAEMIRNESSGNGAWIMKKCADALGGSCRYVERSEDPFALWYCARRLSDTFAIGRLRTASCFSPVRRRLFSRVQWILLLVSSLSSRRRKAEMIFGFRRMLEP
jgi:signal transduction histidine kinase